MDRAFLDAVARAYALPPPLVELVAATVAERCALIANRQGSNLASSTDAVGASIGAAILAAFTPDELPVPEGAPFAATCAATNPKETSGREPS